MNKEAEKLWKSYAVQKEIIEIKRKEPKLNSLYEKAINETTTLYGEENVIDFISWLYEYIRETEKIAFKVGYNFGKK